MSEMIERVARAICEASGQDPERLSPALPNITIRRWQMFKSQARAAIEAVPLERLIVDAYVLDAALSQDTHSLPPSPEAAKPAGVSPSAPAGTNSTGDA